MDASELIAALESDPQALGTARRLLLTDALLALPDLVAENSRQIAENGRQIAELREEIAKLRAAVTENTRAIAELRDGLAENGRQVVLLAHGLNELAQALVDLKGDMRGMRLESAFRNHAYGYFGRLVKRAHAVTQAELAELLGPAVDDGRLSEGEAAEVALADVIVSGRNEGQLAYLVVEVSTTINPDDLKRAERRALLLARLGTEATGVVAGEGVTGPASTYAAEAAVVVILDGRQVA